MEAYARHARRAARALLPDDRARERMLRESRDLVRICAGLIRDLHQGTWSVPDARRAQAIVRRLAARTQGASWLVHHGAVHQAFGEYAEARLLQAHLRRDPPPTAEDLGVPPAGYLLGLGDLVGELRRVALARLLRDDLVEAQRAFDAMEKVYEALGSSSAPESVVALRAKVDTARSLVERTRGEIVTGKRAKELERKIDGVSRLLEEIEGPKRPVARKKPTDDLDLDAAWNKS